MYNEENVNYCKRIVEELEQYYNGELTNDDGDILTLYDYFNDVLDYEYLIDSRLDYKAVKIYVTLGGPTVWIDTYNSTVELRWANEKASYYLLSDIRNEIDDIFEEYYNSCK